jgi:chromosome segregation ATPase
MIVPEPFTFDDELGKALLYVCANSLVCDTLEIARKLCFEHGEKIKGKMSI